MARVIWVTGASGFLGSNLVASLLLQDSKSRIICPVRPLADKPAKNRVFDEIRKASYVQDIQIPPGWEERLEILETEFKNLASTATNWINRNADQTIDAFWHLASTVTFENSGKLDVKDNNVSSTRLALDTAVILNPSFFNYFSTAYVAGNRSGEIDEVIADRSTQTNNVYEESKLESEWQVKNTCEEVGLSYRIFRPSIVVGHSRTGRANSESGLYHILKGMVKSVKFTDRFDPAYRLNQNKFRVDIQPDSGINLVPVDKVIEKTLAIDAIGSGSEGRIYHLVSNQNASNADLLSICSERIGLELIGVGGNIDCFDQNEYMFNLAVRVFKPYLNSNKRFSAANIGNVLGKNSFDEWVPTRENLEKLVSWYLDHHSDLHTFILNETKPAFDMTQQPKHRRY